MTDHIYVLRFRVTGLDADDADTFEALNAKTADVLVHSIDGVTFVEVVIEGATVNRAIDHALRLLTTTAPAVRVRSLDRELTPATEVADRLGVSREQVRLWATGRRKPDGFPKPARWVGKTRVWDWSEVHAWAREHGVRCEEHERFPDADTVSIVNGALAEARRNRLPQPSLLVRHRLEAGTPARDPDDEAPVGPGAESLVPQQREQKPLRWHARPDTCTEERIPPKPGDQRPDAPVKSA